MVATLVVLGIIVVPWLLDKLSKPTIGQRRNPILDQPFVRAKRGVNRRHSTIPENEHKEEFPHYNPKQNDEVEWRNQIEPKFRKHPGLPPDWERRRALICIRAKKKCEKCGRTCGHLACEPDQIWGFRYDEHLLFDADVHHVKHRVSGGDHALDNLLLYCLRCHSLAHPENLQVRARRDLKGLGGGGSKSLFPRKAPKPTDKDVPF